MAAGGKAGGIVVSVAVRRRASGLENLRILVRRTRLRAPVVARATVLRTLEGIARAPAGNGSPVAARDAECSRAAFQQIGAAPSRPAVPSAARRADAQSDVVAVHEAHVVEILAVVATDCELGQSGGRLPASAIALQAARAVARCAGAGARLVESAARAAPDTTRPARWGVQRHGLSRREGKTATSEGRPTTPRQDARPDCRRALVDQREHCSANSTAPE